MTPARGWSSGDAWPTWASPAARRPTAAPRSSCAWRSRRWAGMPCRGPWVESAAYLPVALGREVDGVATVACPRTRRTPWTPTWPTRSTRRTGRPPSRHRRRAASRSVDPTRRLFAVTSGDPAGVETAPTVAFDLAVLATSAQLLGCGERLLADTVAYAKQRRQFGREIGSYQAIKHRAGRRPDRTRLRPAAGLRRRADRGRARDVSAAKVACGGRGVPRLPDRRCRSTAPSATPREFDLCCGSRRSARWSAPGARPRSTGPGSWRLAR